MVATAKSKDDDDSDKLAKTVVWAEQNLQSLA